MASIISHIAIPLAMRLGLGKGKFSTRLVFFACLASILPDGDVIGFSMGIAYSSEFGHRGFTHSILFALIIGFIGLVCYRYLKSTRLIAFLVLFISTLSHAVLDAMTNGGLGVAFFWPYVNDRYFLPWRPIDVSPIGISNFLTERGLTVLQSELVWIWLPVLLIASFCLIVRRIFQPK